MVTTIPVNEERYLSSAPMSDLVQVQRWSTESAVSFDAETGKSRPRRETHFSAKLVVESFHRRNHLAR